MKCENSPEYNWNKCIYSSFTNKVEHFLSQNNYWVDRHWGKKVRLVLDCHKVQFFIILKKCQILWDKKCCEKGWLQNAMGQVESKYDKILQEHETIKTARNAY